MRRAVVERVEVVVDGLHLRPLHDGEAEAEKDVFELTAGLGEQMQAPDRLRGRARKRHVDAIVAQALLELVGAEKLEPAVDQLLQRLAGLVGGAADLRALGGGSSATPRSSSGSSAFRPRCRTRSSSSASADVAAEISASARSSAPRCGRSSRGDPRWSAGHLIQRHRRGHRGIQGVRGDRDPRGAITP